MIFCEECRIQKQWIRPRAWPYHEHDMTRCEVCNKHKDCYIYPAIFLKPHARQTLEEKQLDNASQQEYHKLAEDLEIRFVSGPNAGKIDHLRDSDLRKLIRQGEGNEIDWCATYRLRQVVQEGYRRKHHR